MIRAFSPAAAAATLATILASITWLNPSAQAQTANSLSSIAAPARITSKIDDNVRVTLGGMVHQLARASNDLGALPDSTPLKRVQILLKRSDAQDASLKQLIEDLHNPTSSSYHQWLTPAQFGKQFGPSDADVQTLETWLSGQGFGSFKLNPGSQTLEFDGTAGQFRSAFHAEMHKYTVAGGTHFSNNTDPQIPAALAPVFGGFASLNNFPKRTYLKDLGKASYNPSTGVTKPTWTIGNSTQQSFVLSPADFAVQYDTNPLYSASVNGSGQTIAIINESNINVYLVNQFRTLFGLPANPPQVIIDGQDPGIDGINNPDGPNYASGEAYLDVEWAGAVAPQATIDLVIGADTAVMDGLDLAAERAVYSNLAPVMSLSFGACEASVAGGNAFYNSLWQQAAAQGITVMVSSGDNGSAGCDNADTQAYAVDGQAVNGLASTPYNVAVGGTDFYYSSYNQGSTAINNQLSTYWNTTPSNSTPTVSIKGYIPEQPWNDSQYGLNLYSYYSYTGDTNIVGGGGGASTCGLPTVNSSGSVVTCHPYPKPSWQTGTGVPADSVRDLPDVSLFAANGQNDSFYPVCLDSGDCQAVASGGTVQITGIGGTSASAPAFAGIMALVNQKYGRQGQANYTLYPLASQYPSAFHDVTVGTNTVPCAIGTTNCISVSSPLTGSDSVHGSATEGEIGTGSTAEYNANSGYDLATGLGTVDANLLVTNWGNVKFAATTTTLTPSSTSFAHGTSITLSGSVTGTSGTPTGSVAVISTTTEQANQGQLAFALNNGAFTGSTNSLPGGTYTIYGRYSGDGTNASSSSTPVNLTVTPESSATVLFGEDVGTEQVITTGRSFSYGTSLGLGALVGPTSQSANLVGCEITGSTTCTPFQSPTGSVSFYDNGAALRTTPLTLNGEADYNYAAPVGSHSISASYSGDNSYNASSATAYAFTITKNTPDIYPAASNANSSGQIVLGQQTYFNIIVENSAKDNDKYSSGAYAAAPTGSITVSGFPGVASASYTLSPGIDPSSTAPDGVATIPIPATATAGTYTVSIAYAGDTNYNAVSGGGTVQFIAGASGLATPTISASTSASSPTPGAAVVLTATVSGSSSAGEPTGTVAVYSNGYELGSGALVTGTSGSQVQFTLQSGSLLQGINVITLQYSGDTHYLPAATTLNISNTLADFTLVPATALITTPTSGVGSDAITIATTTGYSGTVNLTCTNPSGLSCAIYPSSVSLSSGSALATVITTMATSGSYNVVVTGTDSTGQYIHTLGLQVTGNAVSSTTPAITLVPASSITVATPGGTGSTSVYAASSGGFSGSVNLTCAVTALSGGSDTPTCSITSPVNVTTTTAGTATLSITTTAATASLHDPFGTGFAPLAGGVVLASLAGFLLPRRRRKLPFMLAVLMFAVVPAFLAGCGSGSSSSGGGTGGGGGGTTSNPGTTVGSYTVTVNASDAATGKVTATTTVNLTVN